MKHQSLVEEIASIIERDQPSHQTAIEIVRVLKAKSKTEVKSKRPLGWVSQHDLFRGK